MFNNRMDAATSLGPGETQRKIEGGPHQRDAEDSDQGRRPGKAGFRQRETAALLSQ